jgi:hypothetical protein
MPEALIWNASIPRAFFETRYIAAARNTQKTLRPLLLRRHAYRAVAY